MPPLPAAHSARRSASTRAARGPRAGHDAALAEAAWWQHWWGRLPPARQDRFAVLGPLFAVVLFMTAIVVAIGYLRIEERERELEAVTRDVEYAQQRLRLRLLERQEQLMRLAREISNREIDREEFIFQSENLISQYPELLAISWVDARRRVVVSYASPSAPLAQTRSRDQLLSPGETDGSFDLARDLRQPIYSRPLPGEAQQSVLMLQVPLAEQGRFGGTVMGEYLVDGLLRFGIPPEVMARYAVALLDDRQQVLAGSLQPANARELDWLPWSRRPLHHAVPVSPVGNGLILKAQGYRTSQDVVGSGFLLIIGALSALTVWMLLASWRHTRRRAQTQQALVAETNFRRAMENSMLTGMRALDLQGRITYVNPAFCLMTGWSESELVGRTAPFPYWPDEDVDILASRLEDELRGRSTPGGFEVRVKRKDGGLFDARMYVSPLIDPNGQQTGWMTSMTDITEPKRIREELSASYERFTTVLESLDATVSVAPLGSEEVLFANKMYRQWFGPSGRGHRMLVDLAGVQPSPSDGDDAVDAFAGMPTDPLTDAGAESAEIFVETLEKWLEVRSRYLTWVDGRLAQLVIASDITQRRNAEEQAARQNERAQTASRLITMGEMASSVAHELNQPLTAISNYCNGMISRVQRQQITEEELLGALEKTARQAHRAGQIIQRIKAFVKRSEPNPTLSEVPTMVSNALELAEIELRRHQIRVTTYVAARLPPLLVDPILIEQVLINLLKNAGESILHAQRAPGQRFIELRVGPLQQDGVDCIEFAITDSGSGVPTDMLERIYEAFYSTKAEGMGIGLKLCRSIVESHHGRMKVQNIYNGDALAGCCFSFWIPAAQALPRLTAAR